MQIQTVFKAGNSHVVAIPKELNSKLNIKAGQKVVLEESGNGNILIRKVTAGKVISLEKNFKKWWQVFLKENAEILDELAVR